MSDKSIRELLLEAWNKLSKKEKKEQGTDLSAAGAAKKVREEKLKKREQLDQT